jgi:hypothetical protein
MDAARMGLNVWGVINAFGGPLVSGGPPVSVQRFALQAATPTRDEVVSFFGNVWMHMRSILKVVLETGRAPWKGMWYFYNRNLIEDAQGNINASNPFWLDVMVYTDAQKAGLSASASSGEAGMWWPALAVQNEYGQYETWCQDFAINRSKETWTAHPSRVCIVPATTLLPTTPGPIIEEVSSGSASGGRNGGDSDNSPATTLVPTTPGPIIEEVSNGSASGGSNGGDSDSSSQPSTEADYEVLSATILSMSESRSAIGSPMSEASANDSDEDEGGPCYGC